MATRVFVVDDERTIADTLAAILSHHGYQTRAFYDAASALAACAVEHPDLVISDVVMPQCNGIDLAIQIKERYPACKILLFSGHAGTVDFLHQARQLGHNFEVLSKPIHPKDLLARLEMEMTAPSDPLPSQPSAARELRR
ncbi:MAG: response regulator [Acidobacteriaceae bacterium]